MLSGPCVADPCLLYSVQFPGYLGLFLGNLTSVLQVSQEEFSIRCWDLDPGFKYLNNALRAAWEGKVSLL